MRGQYDGYRSIDGVAADSTTETYAALRLEIDNWRWSGVPFFIRTGKRLPVTQTELRLVFKFPPGWDSGCATRRASRTSSWSSSIPQPVCGSSSPRTGPTRPKPAPVELDMEFAAAGGEGPTPYEVLLHAAMTGQSTRFTRQDSVEEEWRVMQPLIDAPPTVHSYVPGSWGPEAADALVAEHGGWRGPWIPVATKNEVAR